MKHLQRFLLIILLLLVSIIASAYDVEIDGIYYNLFPDDNTAEVTYREKWESTYSGDVVIPETIEYKERTFSVFAIGNDAFYGCSSLQSVVIPNSVIVIGGCAFSNCI